jgi:hypothetical protein
MVFTLLRIRSQPFTEWSRKQVFLDERTAPRRKSPRKCCLFFARKYCLQFSFRRLLWARARARAANTLRVKLSTFTADEMQELTDRRRAA